MANWASCVDSSNLSCRLNGARWCLARRVQVHQTVANILRSPIASWTISLVPVCRFTSNTIQPRVCLVSTLMACCLVVAQYLIRVSQLRSASHLSPVTTNLNFFFCAQQTTASLLGYECLIDAQCQRKVTGSFCSSAGTCACHSKFVPYRKDKCLPGKFIVIVVQQTKRLRTFRIRDCWVVAVSVRQDN